MVRIPGRPGRDLPPEIDRNTLRQAVAGDLALCGLCVQRFGAHDVRTGPVRHQSVACFTETGKTPHPFRRRHFLRAFRLLPAEKSVPVPVIAHGAALVKGNALRMTAFLIPVPDRAVYRRGEHQVAE